MKENPISIYRKILCSKLGFTVIELLVSVAIIGLLVALLLPAVLSARESARRIVCKNNLRQIALSLENFESANGHYPSGISEEPFFFESWFQAILPFVEQAALFENTRIDYERSPIPFAGHRGLSQEIALFECPSDPDSGGAKFCRQSNLLVAMTNYLGVAGADHISTNGIMFKNSESAVSEISDGLSNTLLIGERPPDPSFCYGWWYSGVGQDRNGSADLFLGVAELKSSVAGQLNPGFEGCPIGPYVFERGEDSLCDALHFWSHHPGGAHFSFADGSVRFLPYSIQQNLIRFLSTKSDGEAVSDF